MIDEHDRAAADFRRMIGWIVLIAMIATIGALVYLGLTGSLYLHMVVAVIGGVFISVLLGSGLFAASFYSNKSGHDEAVRASTARKD